MASLSTKTMLGTCAVAITMAAFGCGPATPAPTTAPAPADGATPAASASAPAAPTASAAPTSSAPASTTWNASASKDEKVAFMKANVMPKMTPVFQAHDSSRYAKVTCMTCHGPEFKDPKDFLPHLTLKDGAITAFKEKPEVAKWMVEKVVPEMAAAMGLKPYDMKTHEGFGCAGCHTIDKK